MNRFSSLSSLGFFACTLLLSSCQTMDDDSIPVSDRATADAVDNPFPSPERAAAEAAETSGHAVPSGPDLVGVDEKEPVLLRFKEDLFQFQPNTAKFTSASRDRVKEFGKVLAQYQQKWQNIEIRGHSDGNTKNPKRNQELSELRAKAVLEAFAATGIAGERMRAEGYGATQPLPGKDPKDAENRRVELILSGANHGDEFLGKLSQFVDEK